MREKQTGLFWSRGTSGYLKDEEATLNMCGIVGFYRSHLQNEELLEKMAAAIHHRGPDEDGTYVEGGVHLAHKRLSIIDLESGRQPMSNEDGSLVIVFNGEIYNYKEIRDELKENHTFRTRSDTEVILHAYEEMGRDVLNVLNGMFSFVIYDKRNRKFFAARDRCGQKPFYYTCLGAGFAFASELKAFEHCPWLDLRPSPEALAKYFAYEYVPVPWTLYEGVFKLEPAHYLEYDISSGRLEKTCYWRTDYSEPANVPSEEEASEGLQEQLEKAVAYRMIADVPVGVFLSGGLDSSTCLALIRKQFPSKKIQTFSIGFDNKSFDESDYARKVSERFETEHITDTFTPEKMCEILPEIQKKLDDPLADASLIPTFLLCRHARKNVKVAIGGDASDELLAGYPTFLAHKVLPNMKLPGPVHTLLTNIANALPVNMDNYSLDFKIKQTIKGLRAKNPIRNQIWLGAYDSAEIKKLFHPDYADTVDLSDAALHEELLKHWQSTEGVESLNRMNDLYLKSYLTDDILLKVDRASMMNSLEVRAPFLDVHVVEYISRLPFAYKLKGKTTKHLLKKMARKHLPDDIIDRPKKGFGIPISHWFRNELKGLLQERIEAAPDYLNKSYLQQLFDDHQTNKKDNRKPLYTYFMLQPFLNT